MIWFSYKSSAFGESQMSSIESLGNAAAVTCVKKSIYANLCERERNSLVAFMFASVMRGERSIPNLTSDLQTRRAPMTLRSWGNGAVIPVGNYDPIRGDAIRNAAGCNGDATPITDVVQASCPIYRTSLVRSVSADGPSDPPVSGHTRDSPFSSRTSLRPETRNIYAKPLRLPSGWLIKQRKRDGKSALHSEISIDMDKLARFQETVIWRL